jgi:hypothetical protein
MKRIKKKPRRVLFPKLFTGKLKKLFFHFVYKKQGLSQKELLKIEGKNKVRVSKKNLTRKN